MLHIKNTIALPLAEATFFAGKHGSPGHVLAALSTTMPARDLRKATGLKPEHAEESCVEPGLLEGKKDWNSGGEEADCLFHRLRLRTN